MESVLGPSYPLAEQPACVAESRQTPEIQATQWLATSERFWPPPPPFVCSPPTVERRRNCIKMLTAAIADNDHPIIVLNSLADLTRPDVAIAQAEYYSDKREEANERRYEAQALQAFGQSDFKRDQS